MAVILDNDILRVRAVCYAPLDTQLGECIMTWKVVEVTDSPTDVDVAAALAQAWAPPFRAWMSPDTEYRGVGIKRVAGTNGPTAEVINTGFSGVGTQAGVSAPPQVSGLVRHKSAGYYVGPSGKTRLAQGRLFIPFPAAVWLGVGGAMTDAGKLAIGNIATTISLSKIVVGAGGTCQIVLGTYVTLGPGPTLVKDFKQSRSIAHSTLWATQRRRGEYGRTNTDPFI